MGVKIDPPPEALAAAGLRDGDEPVYEPTPEGLLVYTDSLRKVYVEATGRCNLACAMCPRLAWSAEAGDMTASCYGALLDGLPDAPPDEVTVAFGGFGEPTLHPGFLDLIAGARSDHRRVEVISNGTMIGADLAARMVDLGVGQVTLSMDGGDNDTYAALRGTDRHFVLDAAVALGNARRRGRGHLAIGFACVATRRNAASLPSLVETARSLGLDFVTVSGLVPHSRESASDALWTYAATASESPPRSWRPHIVAGRFDLSPATRPLVESLLQQVPIVPPPAFDGGARRDGCRFARDGMLAIGWDGRVAPCLSLLYAHPEHISGREKTVKAISFGSAADTPLTSLWRDPGYREFRARVRALDGAPCLPCGGCAISETNETDCFGTAFPSCSECLWARGIVICP